MSIHFGGSTNLSWTGQIVTAFPFTLFAWVKPTTAGVNGWIMEAGTNTRSDGVMVYESTSGNMRAGAVASGNTTDSTTATATAWQPIMLVCNGATDRKLYYAGGAVASDTASGSITFASLNRFTVGIAADGSTLPFNGDIAEVAIWSSALSGANFTTLSGDTQPETVAAGSLIESWSLLTATTLAGTVSRTFTATSATTGATHPITRTGIVPPLPYFPIQQLGPLLAQ